MKGEMAFKHTLEKCGFLFIQDSYKIIYFDLDEKEHYHSH